LTATWDAIVRTRTDASPQTINHSGQLPSVTISFNLRPGVSLGEAVDKIQEAAAQNLPDTITTGFQGTAKVFQESLKNLTLLLIIAIGVVYIVLGILYESYVHPLTILSGLPSAGFGALLTLMIFKVDLSIYAFVGLMMLIGIVKKNAIMQIDFALEAERRDGKSPAEAIYEGCLIRFRPIMMTTAAAMLGAVPIALGWGSGGEARRPLGLTVAGGLLFSQMITLYLTPVIYTTWQRSRSAGGRRTEWSPSARGRLRLPSATDAAGARVPSRSRASGARALYSTSSYDDVPKYGILSGVAVRLVYFRRPGAIAQEAFLIRSAGPPTGFADDAGREDRPDDAAGPEVHQGSWRHRDVFHRVGAERRRLRPSGRQQPAGMDRSL
jgi:preprotein translocase subunit SecF